MYTHVDIYLYFMILFFDHGIFNGTISFLQYGKIKSNIDREFRRDYPFIYSVDNIRYSFIINLLPTLTREATLIERNIKFQKGRTGLPFK